jgi:ribosomal protein L18E
VAHCIYDWQASIRAMNRVVRGESPVYVHSRVLDEDHIAHCGIVIADRRRRTGAKAEVHFGLGECVRLDEVVRSKAKLRSN